MIMKKFCSILFTALALGASTLLEASCGNKALKELEAGFDNPPAECHPSVWWHWMNGMITPEGIRKDLLWMDRIGISGIHCFDAAFRSTPAIVRPRRPYMSEGWKEAFNLALDIADSLGMEMTIASSPGWSITGGPWVSEDDAQKKLVWSTLTLEGGCSFKDTLASPPSCSGPYQDELQYPKDPDRYRYYRDVCVLAVKLEGPDTVRIDRIKEKAGFVIDPFDYFGFEPAPGTLQESTDICKTENTVDLTDSYRDGVLEWNVPEGRWKIFRFGYSLLGRTNGPSVPEATGLEADKLDAGAMRRYYTNYLELYRNAVGGKLGGKGVIKNFLIDSYEAGKGTWTPRMEEEFASRRGYALRPWLPVLTGQVVGSVKESEQFLFDWRQTLGELIVENHYDQVNDILKPYGMRRFSESHEERRAFVGDGMSAKKGADMPMSAFWVRSRAGWYAAYPGSVADIRESASVAHIYGQNLCGAESFTTNGKRGKWDGYWAYQCHPGYLKRFADDAMAQGLNRFIIHSSVHQPSDEHVPGLSLGIYGQWFNRHDTWAEEAGPWIDYLSRSSFMLSQGRNVADIAFLYGEDTNPSIRFYGERNSVPAGYNYDFVNAEILEKEVRASKGRLVARSGAEYRMVMIDTAIHKMSIGLVRSLAKLASAGVPICGNRPLMCAGRGFDEEFDILVKDIWDSGRSNVHCADRLTEAFAAAGLEEDAVLGRDSCAFVHRKLDGGELYWVANISSQPCTMEVSLRCNGLRPQIWHADSGIREDAAYSISDGRTVVRLDMDRDDAQFIVLMEKAGKNLCATVERRRACGTADELTDWTLTFPDGRGAPEKYEMKQLRDLSGVEEEGIRYYSGTTVYKTVLHLDDVPQHCSLDLGKVCNMARLFVNGNDLGLLWKEPYRATLDGVLKEGDNVVEIRVTNSWANRLIGDARSARDAKKYSFTAERYYAPEDPLPQSGLVGPVLLVREKYETRAADGGTTLSGKALYESFINPPKQARPRVWWHWMNGNITKEGIRKDLEWMHDAGIAGFHNFDAGLETPQAVKERLIYMTPEWKDAFRYAMHLADSLDLEVTIASSPGWSETGGPWVKPENAMKKIVWRECEIQGGSRVNMQLPEPYRNRGDFQNESSGAPYDPVLDNIYGDIAVIAVRMPDGELSSNDWDVSVKASDGADTECFTDNDYNSGRIIGCDSEGKSWLMFSFKEPQMIRSISLGRMGADRYRRSRILEASDDGVNWTLLSDILPDAITKQFSFNVRPTTARHFRYSSTDGTCLECAEIRINASSRVEIDTEKAGFYISGSVRDNYPTPPVDDAVPEDGIIDISRHCRDGKLNWNAPEGRWKILRFGWSLTGKVNAPASPEATGLEVDKFDRAAVLDYYDNYLSMYQEASDNALGKVISHIMIDSYEAGCQNWTRNMEREFESRRGYAMRPWMPALAGIVIGSADRTERFLSDWRKTLGELMKENHYEAASVALSKYGMKRHTESHEAYRAFVGDGLDVKRNADIPMSAFWTKTEEYGSYPMSEADIRESASVAHIYGQNICAAESFTNRAGRDMKALSCSPCNLKSYADAAMASGLNRFIIHCSPHQPEDNLMPGMSLGPYGQWFTRQETWASEARAWTDYLSRSCHMLQQGRFVADIAYFYSENTNITARFKLTRPQIPEGYAFDFVNSTALTEALRPEDGKLVTATGMAYRALYIDNEVRAVSMSVLRSIAEAAKAGVLIVGNEPVDWLDLQEDGEEFSRLIKDIWHSGRSNVVPFEKALTAPAEAGMAPDVMQMQDRHYDNVRFVHRRLEDGELYWIANVSPEYRKLELSLRTDGRVAQIWHADDGRKEDASFRIENGRTVVSLDMTPDDALFVVLMEKAEADSRVIEKRAETTLKTIEGEWRVRFEPGRGAPEEAVFPHLVSYDSSEDEGIRYFSGIALYNKQFNYSGKTVGVLVDLGEVCQMARVYLNGKDLGLVWKQPYRLDTAGALRQGENNLQIKVINSWVNRLVGDAKESGPRITYTTVSYFDSDSETDPAGLLGPVRLIGY